MTRIDDVRAKMPCPLDTLFCIINQIQTECVEPWYGQIKKLADGANKWNSEMHKAVIFGMYPELEEASIEHNRRYKNIYNEFKNNPHKDRQHLPESHKKLSFQIGEEYNLNENRYVFNEMTEEQAKRVQERKNVEIKNMCNNIAEALPDPLHIVMQGLCQKLDPKDCEKLMNDFDRANSAFIQDKNNNLEVMKLCRKKFPEVYSIYRQIKNSIEVAGIKDYEQTIDDKNYAKFVQTLGSFKYNGKEYNLTDVVRPITQKRNFFGRITEIRSNSPSLPNKLRTTLKSIFHRT